MKLEDIQNKHIRHRQTKPPEGYLDSFEKNLEKGLNDTPRSKLRSIKWIAPLLAAACVFFLVWFSKPLAPQEDEMGLLAQLSDEELVEYYLLEEDEISWEDDSWMDDLSEDDLAEILIEDDASSELLERLYKN